MFTRLLAHASRALPSQCAVCGTWGPGRVCAACIGRFSSGAARCPTCALTLVGAAQRCGPCLQHGSALDACWAAVDYAYPWDGLLAQLKFAGAAKAGGPSGPYPAVARALADILRQHAPLMTALQQADWVVPIPLSSARLRQRGFNQALEIAKHLLAPHPAYRLTRQHLHPGLLLRTQDTPAQVGLARSDRLRNLQHAFAVEPLHAALLKGAHVVLVDDVTTTTATLCAAAAALRAAGARQVVGVVFARTPL
jgi:ComF family protein